MEVPRYSLAERDRRWALARKLMAAHQVEALIAWSDHERAAGAAFAPDTYFSNNRPGSVVIFCRDASPFQLVCQDLPGQADPDTARHDQGWVDPARIRAGRGPGSGANAPGIAGVLREHHLERAAVGVLGPDIAAPWLLNSGPLYPLWRDLLAELPGVTFRPVGQGFMLAAMCLSKEELAVLRYCAAAGDAMARAMLEAAAAGVTEAAVYAAGTAAALGLGCQAPAMPMCSGPGPAAWGLSGWWYRPEPPRVLSEGDVLLAEPVSRVGLLETRHPVAIAIGSQHPDIETAAVIARASYEAGLRAACAGTMLGDLAQAMLAPLKVSGARNTRPLLYALTPLGLVPGPGRASGAGQIPAARRCPGLPGRSVIGGDLPLTPGMSWVLGPSAVVDGRAVTLGGTIIIGEYGPIELNPFTARLLRVC